MLLSRVPYTDWRLWVCVRSWRRLCTRRKQPVRRTVRSFCGSILTASDSYQQSLTGVVPPVCLHPQATTACPTVIFTSAQRHFVDNVVKQWHSDAYRDLGACGFIVSGLWDVDFIYQLVFLLLLSKHYKTTYLDNVWLTDVVMLVLVRVVLEKCMIF